MKRKIYLEDIPLDEAISTFENALKEVGLLSPLPAETIAVREACDRVTAEPIWAKISSPHYNASAMYGYALRSRDTEGATETSPLTFTLVTSNQKLGNFERPAVGVDTGQPLPEWADSVVMVENTQQITGPSGELAIEIRASTAPWKHVRLMGEDMVASELVIPANYRLRPVDLGAITGSGHAQIRVYRRPKVAIIPTGSELIGITDAVAESLQPGNIIEYNSIVLAAQVEKWGGIATCWPIIPDDFLSIQQAVRDAAQNNDLILVNAGSSAGTKDFTARIVESLGRLLVHGIAIRPGHPVILGVIGGDPVHDEAMAAIIGVPGYPVSTALTSEIIVQPLLARWQGQPAPRAETIRATTSRKIMSHTGDDDFVRVVVGKVNENYIATPISRGAGVISSLVRADGLVRIPRFSEGLNAGANVDVYLYRTPKDIDNTVVAIGSHDLTLDLISQLLSAKGLGQRLSSANVGSLSGLLALRRGEAHIAGSHLLDPKSGEYNDEYVKRYVPNRDMVLVSLVEREQGWIVPQGNPRGLASWDDILAPDIRLINRQRGAGTRVLLDFELGKRGIDGINVCGYKEEAYTHLSVAAAVSSGAADVGLGIAAAARALDLDFVPLAKEQFELVMAQENYESKLLQPLLDLLLDGEFLAAVNLMPGYSTERTGTCRNITG